MKFSKKNIKDNLEIGVIISSVTLLIMFVILMILKPSDTIEGISALFNMLIKYLGPVFQVVFFLTFIVAVYLGIGKYGNIKMGNSKPKYSMFSYISMMLLASLASAALYWSFTEWAYYYQTPGLGLVPMSAKALEASLGYQFFHWGMTNQAVYTIMGIAIAYAVYVKKVKSYQTSAVCCEMMGDKVSGKAKKWIGKMIDFCVVFGILGGLGSSLGLAIPMFAAGLHKITGWEVTPLMQISILLVLAVVYTIMSYVGIDKGMKLVSNTTSVVTILFLGFIFIVGPTSFILKNIVNSMGFMLNNIPQMSLFTDPILNTGFPETWTIYFEAFYLNYVAMMGIFIAKISEGRTIREISAATLLGISAGGWLLFGINGSYAIKMNFSKIVNVVGQINSGSGDNAIYDILETLPLGTIVLPIIILLLIIGFVAPSLDSASLALSETVTKKGEPKKSIRIFWCVLLAVMPMTIILTNNKFDAIKQLSVIVSVPFLFILIWMERGLLKWLKEDFNNKNTDTENCDKETKDCSKVKENDCMQ